MSNLLGQESYVIANNGLIKKELHIRVQDKEFLN